MSSLKNVVFCGVQSMKNKIRAVYIKHINSKNLHFTRTFHSSPVLRKTSRYGNFEKSVLKLILNVSQASSKANLGNSFIQLAKVYHPEKYNADPSVRDKVCTKFNKTVKLLEISQAYQGLSEEIKQMDFDIIEFSTTNYRIFKDGFVIDSEKLFKEFTDGTDKTFFDCRTREEGTMKLTFEESVRGASKLGSIFIRDICHYCNGQKTYSHANRAICQICSNPLRCACRYVNELSLLENVCINCGGLGKSVYKKKITVVIPAGVEDGQILQFTTGDSEVSIRIEVENFINFKRYADVISDVDFDDDEYNKELKSVNFMNSVVIIHDD